MKFYPAILELKNDYKFRLKAKKGHLLTQKIGPYLWIFKLRIRTSIEPTQAKVA